MRLPAVLGLLGFAALAAANAFAQPASGEQKPSLRSVMQELQAEYLRLGNALLTDDFAAMQGAAKAIAEHPMPGELVGAIKNKLGRNFHGFERLDKRSHAAAGDLARRAGAKDIVGAAKAFGRLTEACVTCHARHRAALRPLSD